LAILLYRVDERLIHGQVTVGWGNRLHPQRYVVVDDEVAGSPWEQEIHALGVPHDCASEFVTVTEARERLEGWKGGPERVVLLTRDVDHMLRLAAGGRMRGEAVNLGGVHHRPGREEVLPYLYLDAADRLRIRALIDEGVSVSAQDLPGAPTRSAADMKDV